MKKIINYSQIEQDLKKQRLKIILIFVILLFLLISYSIFSCYIQNRNSMKIFIVINSFIWIIYIFFFLIYLTQIIIPINSYLNLIDKILSSNSTTCSFKVIEISKKETYLGVLSNVIIVIDEKTNKKMKLFFQEDIKLPLLQDKIYSISYYHNYIISLEEVIEND